MYKRNLLKQSFNTNLIKNIVIKCKKNYLQIHLFYIY